MQTKNIFTYDWFIGLGHKHYISSNFKEVAYSYILKYVELYKMPTVINVYYIIENY